MPDETELTLYYQRAHKGLYAWDKMSTPSDVADIVASVCLRLVADVAKPKWLDFGSGSGAILAAGARQRPDVQPVGVEAYFDEPHLAATCSATLTPVYPSLESLRNQRPDDKFDLVTMIEVVEHLRTPHETLHALFALLADGGVLFMTTPNAGSLKASLLKERWREFNKLSHLYWFSGHTLSRLCLQAGFKTCRVLRSAIHSRRPGIGFACRRLLECLHLQGTLAIVAKVDDS